MMMMVLNIPACSVVSHCIGVLSGSLFNSHKVNIFSDWPKSPHQKKELFAPTLNSPGPENDLLRSFSQLGQLCPPRIHQCSSFLAVGMLMMMMRMTMMIANSPHHHSSHQSLLHYRWQRHQATASQSCWTRPCFRNQTFAYGWCGDDDDDDDDDDDRMTMRMMMIILPTLSQSSSCRGFLKPSWRFFQRACCPTSLLPQRDNRKNVFFFFSLTASLMLPPVRLSGLSLTIKLKLKAKSEHS